jgi:hypothetical protein
VELAPQEQILALANSLERGNPRNARRPSREVSFRKAIAKPSTQATGQSAPPPAKGHYCKCGQCRICLQNAEWEAKFNQKFGESMKDYYSGTRPTRQASWWSEL